MIPSIDDKQLVSCDTMILTMIPYDIPTRLSVGIKYQVSSLIYICRLIP